MDSLNTEKTKRTIGDIVYYVRKSAKFNDKRYHRRAVKTHFIKRGESLKEIIIKYIEPMCEEDDIVAISKKAVSICQNQVREKKDIKPGIWAKLFSNISSKVLSRNIIGTGPDYAYKFQVLINKAGLLSVTRAYILEALGSKGSFRKKIDNKIYASNIFNDLSPFEEYRELAILDPEEADKICNNIYDNTGVMCIVVGANDYNTEVIAKCDALLWYSYDSFLSLVKDNPFGNPDELTPFVIMKPLRDDEDDDFPNEDEGSSEEISSMKENNKTDDKELSSDLSQKDLEDGDISEEHGSVGVLKDKDGDQGDLDDEEDDLDEEDSIGGDSSSVDLGGDEDDEDY